ncbi:MAG: adenosylmethionine decarboxylase [Phaeodactylibacter sp.]|uniref:adenosylmethionine decarboxylase n=1 Tax=Phaeodactylibacter sp. TaxID=1940289 RepID=UPI0032F09267
MTRPVHIPVKQALGRHVLLELYQCPNSLLKAGTQLEAYLKTAAEKMGATVVMSNFHQFSPYGISGVVIIQESHLTLHTWPEHGYAAVDLFTCGDIDLEAGINYLVAAFEAKRSDWQMYERGKGLG